MRERGNMDINEIVAENLKRLRTERNLSLGTLSELSGISKVMLSQIEKGETNPTINTLWKIANGLKVPYTALMDKHENTTVVIKKSDTSYQVTEEGHYRIYCYYPNTPHRNFELFQIEIDEGYEYTSYGHSEKSEEYIMILEGELTITIGDKSYLVSQNDTVNFTASVRHNYRNSGKGILRAVVINFYPIG